jgi:hypothetical protein
MATWAFDPGAVAASTAVALDPAAPDFLNLQMAIVITEGTPTVPAIVTAVPSAGLSTTQIYLDPTTQEWQYGTTTTSGTTIMIFEGPEFGEWGQVS